MSAGSKHILITTDLDGTLLNHDDYAFGALATSVQKLAKRGIPVVFNTSKTPAECVELQKKFGVSAPMIVENGGGILFHPQDCRFDFSKITSEDSHDHWQLIRLGRSLSQLLAFKDAYCPEAPDLVSSAFDDMAEHTGLSGSALDAARRRLFSLPLILNAEQYARIETKAFDFGYRIESGARFKTLQGRHDKSSTLTLVKEAFAKVAGSQVKVVALGDAPNDQRMLEAGDVAVVVKRSGEHHVAPKVNKIIQTEAPAPDGWIEGVEAALYLLASRQNSAADVVKAGTLRTLSARPTSQAPGGRSLDSVYLAKKRVVTEKNNDGR